MAEVAAWVVEQGGKVRTDLVEVHEFSDGTGRGIRAVADIRKGEVLVEAPAGALVSVSNVVKNLGSKQLRAVLKQTWQRKALGEVDVLAVFLMWARHEGNHKHLSPAFVEYLRILPAVEEGPSALNQTMFWSEEELEWLQGTDSFQIAHQLKKQVREDFGEIVSKLFLPNPKLFPLDQEGTSFTYREYKWALGILWSRGMDFMTAGGRGAAEHHMRAMVPFADLFNTDFSGEVSHRFDMGRNAVQLLARQDFAKGDQVFINYTPTSNTRLAQLYGFAVRPPRNAKFDAIQLWAVMNPADPRFEAASALIAQALPGVDPNRQPFLLTEQDPLPHDLLVALHCQRARTPPVAGHPASPEVLRELERALQERKASYLNKGDRMQDVQLAMRADLSERQRIALYLRLSEGSILEKTLAKLNAMIAALEPSAESAAAAAAPEAAPEATLESLDEMD